jgi:type II secretory pathway component PulK
MMRRAQPREGYVIFAVLIVVVVLSLVAYRFADSMIGEYRAGVRAVEQAQAKSAAVSGLHYAAAILSDRETFYGDLDGNPFDNAGIFERFEVTEAGKGEGQPRAAKFSIRAVVPDASGSYEQRFGVVDEGGKLNINSLIALDSTGEQLYAALMKLPNMTEDVANAIVDWVDTDDTERASGAESSYYQSLPNPYKTKNGPLNSLDELLLVKGVTPELLYGGDRNRNGEVDEGEADDTRGWSDYLTVYGREINVDMSGTVRIYLNGDDLDTLFKQLQQAVGDELAAYILASKVFTPTRAQTTTTGTFTMNGTSGTGTMTLTVTASGGNQQGKRPTVPATTEQLLTAVQAQIAATGTSGKRVRSLMDLTNTQITLPRPPGTPNETPDYVAYSPLLDPTKLNQLLPELLNKTTTRQAVEMVPRINVNSAPREVLLAVPNLTEAEVDAIVNNRPNQVLTDVGTVSTAWLVTSGALTTQKFKQVERYLTGSSMVYRVQSIGYARADGPVARMEAVIDTNQGAPRFLMVRDLSELDNPRGFRPMATGN